MKKRIFATFVFSTPAREFRSAVRRVPARGAGGGARRGEDITARLPDRLLHRLRRSLRYPNLSATGRCGADRREDDRGRRDRTGYAGLFLYDERPDEDADRSLLRTLHRDDGQGVLFYRGGGRRQARLPWNGRSTVSAVFWTVSTIPANAVRSTASGRGKSVRSRVVRP